MEYLCLTLLADDAESQSQFKSRLTTFWTHMLRQWPGEYERVYSEAVDFEEEDGRVSRRYTVEPGVVGMLTEELSQKGIAFLPPDPDEEYSKAEASSNEWFQLEH